MSNKTKSKQKDRIQILSAIQKAANLYKNNLVGKTFLYVFDNRYIEVLYKKINFKHLTGVDSYLSAKDFYQLSVKGKLQTTQINFTARHPFILCKRKVQHLCQIATLAKNESFMLEEIITNTKTYKFGTTDLNFTLCLNKEFDIHGNEKGNCYIVESLRDEDCFSKSKTAYDITHIFVKSNDEKLYTKILFMDKKQSEKELSDNIKILLDDNILK